MNTFEDEMNALGLRILTCLYGTLNHGEDERFTHVISKEIFKMRLEDMPKKDWGWAVELVDDLESECCETREILDWMEALYTRQLELVPASFLFSCVLDLFLTMVCLDRTKNPDRVFMLLTLMNDGDSPRWMSVIDQHWHSDWSHEIHIYNPQVRTYLRKIVDYYQEGFDN